MSKFKNVTVQKKANIYFDGKVISTSISFPDGSKKTLGVMQEGEYENNSEWINIKSGESFEVPKNSSFKLKIHEITNYCCDYID